MIKLFTARVFFVVVCFAFIFIFAGCDTFEQTHEVSFNSRGGSFVPAMHIIHGSIANRPANPERSGWTFANWYSDYERTTVYNFFRPVTAPITLHARWTPIPPEPPEFPGRLTIRGLPAAEPPGWRLYVFSVNTNLATPVAVDSAITSQTNIVARGTIAEGVNGSDFFTLTISGGQVLWTETGSFPVILRNIDSDGDPVFLRATVSFTDGYANVSFGSFARVFVSFTVTFNSNGGSFDGDQALFTHTVETGTPVIPPSNPTRPYYTFLGWFTTNTLLTEFDFTTPITFSRTLWAGWAPYWRTIPVTTSADSGAGSLRAAIDNAVQYTIISIADDVQTIALLSPLIIGRNITMIIEGNSVTITRDASWDTVSSISQLLDIIAANAAVTIRRVHFRDGRATNFGAAINNSGNLTLESCIFSGNRTDESAGAIRNSGSLTVRGSTFLRNNTGSTGGGAILQSGAGSVTTLTGNIFYENTGGNFSVVRNLTADGRITSAGFNVVDRESGTGINQSGWTFAAWDRTFWGLGISGTPLNTTTFEPVNALRTFINSRPANFPEFDFNGNERTWPGSPGAVR